MGKTFDDLMGALMEVRDHMEGRVDLPSTRVVIKSPDVRKIRKKMKLSQGEFAAVFGFSPSTVRAWEQGKRIPDVSVRHYLRVIEHAPQIVIEALR
ncbi:MAG: helix-turn-helix domain-containing protein [Pseudomonadota bacterium]